MTVATLWGDYVGTHEDEYWRDDAGGLVYARDIETRLINGRLLMFRESKERVICLPVNVISQIVWLDKFDCEITTKEQRTFSVRACRVRFLTAYSEKQSICVEPTLNHFPICGELNTFEQN